MAAEKIAVSLPRSLYRQLEGLRRETGESRSALIQRAVAQLVGQAGGEQRRRRYLEGYLRHPESRSEIAAAKAAAVRLLAGEPWE